MSSRSLSFWSYLGRKGSFPTCVCSSPDAGSCPGSGCLQRMPLSLWSSADSWGWGAAPSSRQPGLSRPLVTTTPGSLQVSALKSWGKSGWECRNGKVKPRYQVGQSPEVYEKHLRSLILSEGARHKPSPTGLICHPVQGVPITKTSFTTRNCCSLLGSPLCPHAPSSLSSPHG